MLFVATLALTVATTVVLAAPSRISKRDGSFTIPIKKVDSFTYNGTNQFSGDGLSVADRLTKLQTRVSKTGIKYHHLSKNSKKPISKRANSTLQMGDGPGDFYYFGTIVVGNPPVAFELQLDTGSADLIVMSNPCYSGCEQATPLYRASDSSSAVVSNTPFSIQYGSGDANGMLVTDNVQFGGFALNQTFGALQNSNGIWHAAGSINGILGLAWGTIAQSGATPFLQKLWQNNLLDQPLFAMAFARWETGAITPGGSMSIGAVNPNLFSGVISYTPSSSNSYWVIPLDDVTVSGKALGASTPNALIDTGTSLIYIPQSVAKAFYATIPGSYEAGSGIYEYPCSSVVNANFKFSGINWAVSDRDFNLGSAGGSMCYAGVAYLPGVDLWILGDVFLKNVYSVFRFNPSAIGFATLANPNQLLQGYVPVGNGTTVANGANNTSILSKSTTSAISTSTSIYSTTSASIAASIVASSSSVAISASTTSASPSVISSPSTPTSSPTSPSTSSAASGTPLSTSTSTVSSTAFAESPSTTSVPSTASPASASTDSTINSSTSPGLSSSTSSNSETAGISTSTQLPVSSTLTSTTTVTSIITPSVTSTSTPPASSDPSAISTSGTSPMITTLQPSSSFIATTTSITTTSTTTTTSTASTASTTSTTATTSTTSTTSTTPTTSTTSFSTTTTYTTSVLSVSTITSVTPTTSNTFSTSKSSSTTGSSSVGKVLSPSPSPAAPSSTSSSVRASSSSTPSIAPGAARPGKAASTTVSTSARISATTSTAQSSTVTSTSTSTWLSRGKFYTSTKTTTYTTLTPTATSVTLSDADKYVYWYKCQKGRGSSVAHEISREEEGNEITAFYEKTRHMSDKAFKSYIDSIKCT